MALSQPLRFNAASRFIPRYYSGGKHSAVSTDSPSRSNLMHGNDGAFPSSSLAAGEHARQQRRIFHSVDDFLICGAQSSEHTL